jgi:hypothetical protein
MDELTLLRSTRDDTREPSPRALAAGRAALMGRIADEVTASAPVPAGRQKRWLPRLTWATAGVAAAMTGVLVVGNVTMSAQSAYASDVLRTAAAETINYAELVPGSNQYLRSRTHARWGSCSATGCEPNEQILDVYMPANPEIEWVLYRDWGDMPGVLTGESIETTRALGGRFYDPEYSWVNVDYADIPLDGADAYKWIDGQYSGGSMSRDEDNYVRIADILRSGLVPAPQRAALLDALSRIPGVTATDDVANLDGVSGVAIGRDEPLRAGDRQEIIIDPDTGLVIGERMLAGATIFGWGPKAEMTLTAIETTVVDTAP